MCSTRRLVVETTLGSAMSGDYRSTFRIAGAPCVIAGASFLTLGRRSFAARPLVNDLAVAAPG